VIVGVDPDPAMAHTIRDWTVGYWDALHPYSLGGAYTNFMMDEGADRVQASYGSNYKRLAKIKARYDPANLFHVNQNIQPNS
jgi:FAD/FMN-containing dehydrogenase